jgi:PIN domain nuclease of toxin-antitoxin system
MRILIDTHILIWHLEGDEQLSPDRRSLISNPTNSIFISIASFWEIAIKSSIGRLSLSRPIEEIYAEIDHSTSTILSIERNHTLEVSRLPFHHRDPFDRMIIAQAQVELLDVMTSDGVFADYGLNLVP